MKAMLTALVLGVFFVSTAVIADHHDKHPQGEAAATAPAEGAMKTEETKATKKAKKKATKKKGAEAPAADAAAPAAEAPAAQ